MATLLINKCHCQNQKPLTKSIYLVGPQSTGKTTLANALVKYYGADRTPLISETARRILAEKHYTAADLNTDRCFAMQKDIFMAHFQEEMRLINADKFPYISDRSLIDPTIYAKMYGGGNDWKELVENLQFKIVSSTFYKDPRKSMVILFEPIREFLVDDRIRKMPDNWKELEQLGKMFEDLMEDQGIPYRKMGAECQELEERVKKVVQWETGD